MVRWMNTSTGAPVAAGRARRKRSGSCCRPRPRPAQGGEAGEERAHIGGLNTACPRAKGEGEVSKCDGQVEGCMCTFTAGHCQGGWVWACCAGSVVSAKDHTMPPLCANRM